MGGISSVDAGPSGKLSSIIPWRRDEVKYTKNEIYFDFEEFLSVTLDRDGSILYYDLEGRVKCQSKLSGIPHLPIT